MEVKPSVGSMVMYSRRQFFIRANDPDPSSVSGLASGCRLIHSDWDEQPPNLLPTWTIHLHTPPLTLAVSRPLTRWRVSPREAARTPALAQGAADSLVSRLLVPKRLRDLGGSLSPF